MNNLILKSFSKELKKIAELEDDPKTDGLIYKSEDPKPNKSGDSKGASSYQAYTEDSAFGYKIAAAEGVVYPSKEMKKEYDAANDSEISDLESTDVMPTQYPRNHMAIQV